jgi:hypothetical protein
VSLMRRAVSRARLPPELDIDSVRSRHETGLLEDALAGPEELSWAGALMPEGECTLG